MMKKASLFFGIVILSMVSLHSYAEVPVEDVSDEFTFVDPELETPDRAIETAMLESEEEIALATESKPKSTQEQLSLINKIQAMQQELQELRGQVEVQAHDLKMLKEQQLAFYRDLDSRLGNKKLAEANKDSDKVSQTKQQTKSAKSVSSNPADEQISYLRAYELVKNRQFTDAITAMEDFLQEYPQSGYSANAEYWLGELYLSTKNPDKAIKHFEVVLQKFPSSSKTSASMFKLGVALLEMGDTEQAKKRLQQVISNYPDTNTARLAKDKLKTLNG